MKHENYLRFIPPNDSVVHRQRGFDVVTAPDVTIDFPTYGRNPNTSTEQIGGLPQVINKLTEKKPPIGLSEDDIARQVAALHRSNEATPELERVKNMLKPPGEPRSYEERFYALGGNKPDSIQTDTDIKARDILDTEVLQQRIAAYGEEVAKSILANYLQSQNPKAPSEELFKIAHRMVSTIGGSVVEHYDQTHKQGKDFTFTQEPLSSPRVEAIRERIMEAEKLGEVPYSKIIFEVNNEYPPAPLRTDTESFVTKPDGSAISLRLKETVFASTPLKNS